jgi:hypothetical protein
VPLLPLLLELLLLGSCCWSSCLARLASWLVSKQRLSASVDRTRQLGVHSVNIHSLLNTYFFTAPPLCTDLQEVIGKGSV